MALHLFRVRARRPVYLAGTHSSVATACSSSEVTSPVSGVSFPIECLDHMGPHPNSHATACPYELLWYLPCAELGVYDFACCP